MARIQDFRRLPGTARKYQNTKTGQVYTRRQYEKLVTQAGARVSKTAVKRTADERAMRRYKSIAADLWAEKRLADPSIKFGTVRNSDELKKIVRDLKSKNKDRQRKALEAIGRRKGIPAWVQPGDSDAFRRGQLRPPSRSSGSKTRRRNKG